MSNLPPKLRIPVKPSTNRVRLSILCKRIRKLEQLLNCEDSTIQLSHKLSLKQLRQRVEKLERIVKSQNSQEAEHQLSTPACLKFLLPIASDWQNVGVFLKISDSDLKQIESDYFGRCRDCVREMIRSQPLTIMEGSSRSC